MFSRSIVHAHEVEAVHDNYGGGDLFWIDPQRTANVLFYMRDTDMSNPVVVNPEYHPVTMTTVRVVHMGRIPSMDYSSTAEEFVAQTRCSTVMVRAATPVKPEALTAALPPWPGGYIFSASVARGVPDAPFVGAGSCAIATPLLVVESSGIGSLPLPPTVMRVMGAAVTAPPPSKDSPPRKGKKDKKVSQPASPAPEVVSPSRDQGSSMIMVWQYMPSLALCEVFACVVADVTSPPTPGAIRDAIVSHLGGGVGGTEVLLFVGDPQGRHARAVSPSEMGVPLGLVRSVVYFQRPAAPGARTLYPTVTDYVSRDTHAMAMTNRIASLLR